MQNTEIALGNLDRFLDSGAFLRLSDDTIRLFWGPFRSGTPDSFDLAPFEFFGAEPNYWLASQTMDLSRGDLIRFLEPLLVGNRQWSRVGFGEPRFESFEKSFQIIQGKIQRGEIEKAVPLVVSESHHLPSPTDLAEAILSLVQVQGPQHAYGWWSVGRGALGLTPEILFRRRGMIVETMALAGSCPKGEVAERTSLLKDAKELREHELVINDLVSKLKPLGWLKKNETEIVELPSLLHLRTLLEVSGCAKRDSELVKYLHPTPAVGVSPRAYGFQWMRELPDQIERGYFGGPVMFKITEDETLTLVMIRSVFWDQEKTKIATGCGIVAASQMDREWRELLAKREAILNALGLE